MTKKESRIVKSERAEFVKSEAQFSFELDGDSSISAEALSAILQNTVNVVNGIVQGTPDTYVNLKITKFSTGSFDIDFQTIVEQARSLMSSPEAVATYIVGGISGAFKIAKHLKGKRPTKIQNEGDDSIVINAEGEALEIDSNVSERYFNSSSIENSIINITTIVGLEGREGFNVISEKGKVSYTKEDCEQTASVVAGMIEENEDMITNTVDATLEIRKPDLVGNSKWGFIFDRHIEATIEDTEWLARVRSEGVKFGPGMKLKVKLQYSIKIDNDRNIVGEPIYSIKKVYDIIEDKHEQLEITEIT